MFKKAIKSIKLSHFLSVTSLIFLIVFDFQFIFAQSNIVIGNEETNTTYFPIDRYSNFSRWEGLYLSNEINYSGYLTNIGLKFDGYLEYQVLKNVKIYVKISNSEYLETGNFDNSDYTLVFEGELKFSAQSGYADFRLLMPFYYNTNNGNLMILVEHGYQYLAEYEGILWSATGSTNGNFLSRSNYSNEGLPDILEKSEMRPDIRLGIGCMFIYPLQDISICTGGSQIGNEVAVEGPGVLSFTWDPSTSLEGNTLPNPYSFSEITQQYYFTVTSNECEESQTSDTMTLYVSGGIQEISMGEQKEVVINYGKFYDSGGLEGGYNYNEDYILTIKPCDNTRLIKVTFADFDVGYIDEEYGPSSWLKIYDGSNTEGNLLGSLCGSLYDSDNIGEFSATSAYGGALTFVFHSNESSSGYGWIADISSEELNCNAVCGTPTLTDYGDGLNSGTAMLGLTGNQGTFVKWQKAYNWSSFTDIPNSTINQSFFHNTTTYYRAIVTDGSKNCISYPIRYFTSNNYYVNDASLDSGVWCNAIGSSSNNGLSIDKPKDKLSSILNIYNLKPGDTIFVDAGLYTDNIFFGSNNQGSLLNKITVFGAGAIGKTEFKQLYNSLLKFNGTSNIEFRNLYLNSKDTLLAIEIINSSGISIHQCKIENDGNSIKISGTNRSSSLFADNNRFYHNIFKTKTSGHNSFEINGAVNDLGIDTNYFLNGGIENMSNGIAISTIDNQFPKNINIDSNFFIGFKTAVSAKGTQSYPLRNIKIKNNRINQLTSNLSDGSTSILLNWVNASEVSYNKINGGDMSIVLTGDSNIRVYNNFISNSRKGLTVLQKANNLEIYNNSFLNSLNNINFFGLTNSSKLFIQNNILHTTSHSLNDYCLSMDENTINQLDSCNNNLYYTPNKASLAKFGTINISDLTILKRNDHVIGGSNGDESSFEGNPEYFDAENGDLTLYESSVADGKAIAISWILDDITHSSVRQPPFVGASHSTISASPNGPFAELKRKLDGGYHLSNVPYLLIKYTEEYNPLISKLKFKIYDMNRTVVLSSDATSPIINTIPIKYGDNYCSIKLYGCANIDNCGERYLEKNKFYLLEVYNDKNEKWFLRFKHTYNFTFGKIIGYSNICPQCIYMDPNIHLTQFQLNDL